MSKNATDERSVPMQEASSNVVYQAVSSPRRNRRRDPDCEWVSECPCDWIARVFFYAPVVVALVLVILARRDLAETTKQLHALNSTVSAIDARVTRLNVSLDYRLTDLSDMIKFNGDNIASVLNTVDQLSPRVNTLESRVDTLNSTVSSCCG